MKEINEKMVSIAKDKKILKEYKNRTVFLNDGDNFQIVLFNPTNSIIGAKIYLNDEKIPNMLVIRPGERVWLDRFLHNESSFIFSTYNIENSEVAKNAIAENGKIKVEFFYKETPKNYIICDSITLPWISSTSTGHCINNRQLNDSQINTLSNQVLASYCPNSYCSSSKMDVPTSITYSNDSLETGRIEEGKRSKQKLDYVDYDFQSIPFKTESLLILPLSRKPVNNSDMQKRYCHQCGKRLHPKYKYCPNCGEKII